jgi:mRNA interferase HicA
VREALQLTVLFEDAGDGWVICSGPARRPTRTSCRQPKRVAGTGHRRVKRVDLEKYLKTQGCALDREGANHSWWVNGNGSRRSPVPRHREIKPNLAKAICKQLGVDIPHNVR